MSKTAVQNLSTQLSNEKQQQPSSKRKYSDLTHHTSDITMSHTNCPITTSIENSDQPPAKRRQPKELFRPWLLEDNNKERKQRKQPQIKPIIVQYHPNKVRTFKAKERTPKEQKRRDRNTLTCLMSRRAKKIEEQTLQQEYLEYHQQLETIEKETTRARLYLLELQRLAAATVPPSHLTAMLPMVNTQNNGYSSMPVFVFRG